MGKPGVYKLNASTGVKITSADLVYDSGWSIVSDTDGSIYVGTAGNYDRSLKKYNSSLVLQWDWDWWDHSQAIRGLTIVGDYIYCCGAGGAFKVNKNTGELAQYYNIYNTNPNPSDNPSALPQEWEYDNIAYGLSMNDDYIYVVHQVAEIDGENRNLTIFDHDGLVVDWLDIKDGAGVSTPLLFAITVDTSYNVYIGFYYGTTGDYIIKYNSNLVKQWGYKTNNSVRTLKIIDGYLFACGAYSEDEDLDKAAVRVFNLTTGVKTWDWECKNDNVWSFTVDASWNLYLAGWLWDYTTPGEEELNRYEKQDINGNLLWTYNPCSNIAGGDAFGYGICFDSTGNYVICTGSGPTNSNVSKHWLDKYKMRYDSTADKFKVNAEDNVSKTSYKCKANYWNYTNKKSIVKAEIENDLYTVAYNPSLDDFYTTEDCTVLNKYYGNNYSQFITKMGSNIYFIEGWVSDWVGCDNLIKTDLDLTVVDSTETETGTFELCYFIYSDGTYIYTGRDKFKKYNSSLVLQWEFDVNYAGIRDAYSDGTYIYFAGARGEWVDNPSDEADYQRGNVWKLDSDGELIWMWDANDIGITTTAYGIHGDSSGNIYVTFQRSNSITLVKLNSLGQYVSSYDTGSGSGFYGVKITINSNDDIFVTNGQKGTDEDSNYGDIRMFDTNLVNQWTVNSPGLYIYNIRSVDDIYIHCCCRYKGYPDYNNYYIYKQSDGSLYKKYNLQSYPTCFDLIIDPNGEWVYGCGDGGTKAYS